MKFLLVVILVLVCVAHLKAEEENEEILSMMAMDEERVKSFNLIAGNRVKNTKLIQQFS